MHTASLHYKLIKKIKDDRFEEDSIHTYSLLINVGVRDLQVGVIDPDQRQLLLEDYVFPSLTSHDELLRLLTDLFDSHALLKAAFWKQIVVGIKNNKFVQVPAALYIAESRSEYLKYNAYFDEDEDEVLDVFSPAMDAYTTFAIPKKLLNWFKGIYPSKEILFLHQSAALIEGLMQSGQQKKDNQLSIYVDRFKLHILCGRNGHLVYYNQFTIKQFSDYVRYIMLVMKSLKLDQNTSQVMLWGYIGKNSPHYHEFYKYISNVVFGTRPSFLKFGYIFDEVQDHHFFDLYNMQLLAKSAH